MTKCRVAVLLAASILVGCNSRRPIAENRPLPSDRVAPSPVGTSRNILQKTFNLKKVASFPFEVPPHAARPHLHGTFDSYAAGGAVDETANVDFLIMNEKQYADMQANRPGETMMAAEGTHTQDVDFYLPPSMAETMKYYLVFRNAGGTGSEVVKAEFQVDF